MTMELSAIYQRAAMIEAYQDYIWDGHCSVGIFSIDEDGDQFPAIVLGYGTKMIDDIERRIEYDGSLVSYRQVTDQNDHVFRTIASVAQFDEEKARELGKFYKPEWKSQNTLVIPITTSDNCRSLHESSIMDRSDALRVIEARRELRKPEYKMTEPRPFMVGRQRAKGLVPA